jgi:hypothetical protein
MASGDHPEQKIVSPPHERQYILRSLVADTTARARTGTVNIDALLDALIALHDDCLVWSPKDGHVPTFLQQCKSDHTTCMHLTVCLLI